ncbi:hypothetical protein BVX97_05015 [bacterium E08(2017)]|nr:hypothetical protein BVX97_05015 [bacterium E08(2017)]
MADIQIICPSCGTETVFSEYVSEDALTCRECGAQLHKPAGAGKTKNKPTVKQRAVQSTVSASHSLNESGRQNPQETTAEKPPPHDTSKQQKTAYTTVRTTTKMKQEPKKFKVTDAMWSWVLFLVIGSITGTLKYGGVLTPNDLEMFDAAAPYIYIVAHIFVCLMIAKEAVHSGIISFLFAPYMIYYLFTVTDRFYHRALIAGLAIGMGEPTMIFWREILASAIAAGDSWIHNPYHAQ